MYCFVLKTAIEIKVKSSKFEKPAWDNYVETSVVFSKDRNCFGSEQNKPKNPQTFPCRIWPSTLWELLSISKATYQMSACGDLRHLLSFIRIRSFFADKMPYVQYDHTQRLYISLLCLFISRFWSSKCE